LRKFLIALAAALVSTSAMGADMEIVKKIDVPQSPFSDKVDIQGIKVGMPAAEAWEIFLKNYPTDAPEIKKLGITVQTREVSSQPLEVVYDSDPSLNEDGLQIFISSPSVESRVYGAHREIYYPADKGRPQISAVMEQLQQKYGKPSKVEKSQWDGSTSLFWYIGGTGNCPSGGVCSNVYSPTSREAYNPANFPAYIEDLNRGPEIVIAAYVKENPDKDGKAFSLNVSFVDLKRRGLSAQSDTDQIMAAQKALTEKPATLPEL
jgi:hypothetical protein